MKKPLLSICLRTYNNQEFVLEALEGILKQTVNFDLEFIYSDDCSNDNSYELVKSTLENSNHTFVNVHLAKQPKNLGMIDNLLYLLNNTQGNYIAMCDGDDYWSDPKKSQIQVDFLEAHSEFEVCFTNSSTIKEDGTLKKERLIPGGGRTEFEMRHLPTWVPVSTKIFRNRNFNDLSRTVPGDDVYMLLYQSRIGKIKFLDIVTAAYRYQDRGTYSSLEVSKKKDYQLKTHMECMALVTKELYPKYQNLIVKKIVDLRYLDKTLYLERVSDLKSFMKTYPNRFSNWESIKIHFVIIALRILDTLGVNSGKSLMTKVINKII